MASAEANRIAEWREGFARHLLRLDFKPVEAAPFQVSFSPVVEGVRALKPRFSAGFTIRDEELIKDGDDALTLVVPRSNGMIFAQESESLRLRKGEATLMRHWKPGIVGAESDFNFLAFNIPQHEIASRVPDLHKAVMRRVPKTSAALRLLQSYCDTAASLPNQSPRTAEMVQRHIYDLAGLALSGDDVGTDSEGDAVRAAQLANTLTYITQNFRNPALTITSVAKSQHISPRYMQRLFEKSEISFTAYVNELRLQFAMNLLRNKNGSAHRVSDVALLSGFSDVSHFNRLFRTRFGETPRNFMPN